MRSGRAVFRVVVVLALAASALLPGTAAPAATAADPAGTGSVAPSGARPVGTLAALGDSVAAGYFAGEPDDTAYAAECARTTAAYGYRVAALTGRPVTVLACSGATAASGLLGRQGTVPAQLDQLRKLTRTPSAVTVTIGANDVRQGYFVALCLDLAVDCATDANTQAFRQLLWGQAAPGVARALADLVQRQDVDRVVLTGYYDPFGALAPQFGLQPQEITWYRARVAELNAMLKAQASRTRSVTFVSLSSLDAAAGDIQLDPTQPGFVHPTAQGQSKIAELVAAAIT